MNPVNISQGDSPLILAMPHTGLVVPEDIFLGLNDTGRALADTDWHVHRLYEGLLEGATTVRATFHRYVIDANRDPSGQSLYPGQNTTSLCPLTDFDNQSIYRNGLEPDAAEIERRRIKFHAPYHAALEAEISRVKAKHGIALLYDCHSIRGEVPFLFDGTLPDFNIGTNDGKSCGSAFEQAAANICKKAEGYSCVVNGRFKGGWTTRHYGQPVKGVHAIQMELAQPTYMEEAPPWDYDPARAAHIRPHLQTLLKTLEEIAYAQIP